MENNFLSTDVGFAGIAPIGDGFMKVCESGYAGERNFTLIGVKKFVLSHGFAEVNMKVLDFIAPLILKSAGGESYSLSEAYAQATCESAESLSARVAYHIDKNYDKMRDCFAEKYCYNMGKTFSGTKNFIDKVGIMYALYGND